MSINQNELSSSSTTGENLNDLFDPSIFDCSTLTTTTFLPCGGSGVNGNISATLPSSSTNVDSENSNNNYIDSLVQESLIITNNNNHQYKKNGNLEYQYVQQNKMLQSINSVDSSLINDETQFIQINNCNNPQLHDLEMEIVEVKEENEEDVVDINKHLLSNNARSMDQRIKIVEEKNCFTNHYHITSETNEQLSEIKSCNHFQSSSSHEPILMIEKCKELMVHLSSINDNNSNRTMLKFLPQHFSQFSEQLTNSNNNNKLINRNMKYCLSLHKEIQKLKKLVEIKEEITDDHNDNVNDDCSNNEKTNINSTFTVKSTNCLVEHNVELPLETLLDTANNQTTRTTEIIVPSIDQVHQLAEALPHTSKACRVAVFLGHMFSFPAISCQGIGIQCETCETILVPKFSWLRSLTKSQQVSFSSSTTSLKVCQLKIG